MGKTASPYCLYEEGKIINDAEHAVFECARWQSYRSELTSTIGTITASRENGVSVANYVERILRLKRRDLEAAEQVDVPAWKILADGLRNVYGCDDFFYGAVRYIYSSSA